MWHMQTFIPYNIDHNGTIKRGLVFGEKNASLSVPLGVAN